MTANEQADRLVQVAGFRPTDGDEFNRGFKAACDMVEERLYQVAPPVLSGQLTSLYSFEICVLLHQLRRSVVQSIPPCQTKEVA
ncbi:MAG: hypothetical protein IMZ44_24765 [Planctomycetes bacterium]|nr:hypothetical protein [Planctomycetota bacterium]